MSFCPLGRMKLWSHALGRSRDKPKPLYLLYHRPCKHGRMVTYLEGILLIKSVGDLITWSCKIAWQTKTILSPLPQCLWPPNMAGWWLTLSGSHPPSYSTLWSRDPVRLRDKLKPLYFHYHNPCGHQTWQVVDLPWGSYPYSHMTFNQVV